MIVERIEGEPLTAVLSKRIFEPIGATSMRLSTPIIPHRCSGYAHVMDRIENRPPTEPSSSLGADSMISNIHDFIKWDQALNNNQFLISNIS